MSSSVSKPPLRASPAAPSVRQPQLLSRRGFYVLAACVVAAIFAIYRASLNFQFILDDHRFLGDPRIQMAGHTWEYFSNYVWAQFAGGPPSFYRPLFVLWLRLNVILLESSSWGWHFLSIVKHVAAAALLGLLTWKLLSDRAAAILAATLFVLHPAQVESVAWVTVPDPLLAAPIFIALLSYLRYVEGSASTPETGRKSRKERTASAAQPSPGWLISSAIACSAALLIKETAIVLPAMIFALALPVPDVTLSAGSSERGGYTSRLGRALRHTALFIVVTIVYLLLRVHALGGSVGSRTQHLPWSTIILSWPATLFFYIKVLLWPVQSYAFADPTLVEKFSVRDVLLPGLAVACFVAVVGAIGFWVWRRTADHNRLPGEAVRIKYALLISVLLLVLPILPALDLNALNPGDFLHGRYIYLPSAGFMLLLATGWHLTGKARVPLIGVAAVLAAVLAALTIPQIKQWRDDLTVFATAHELAPLNGPVALHLADAHVQQALQMADEGRCSEALPVFQGVTQQYPQDWFAWAGLGECFVQLENLPKAEDALHRAADLSHDSRVIEQWQELRAHMGLPNDASPN